jgi:hypothetical protein
LCPRRLCRERRRHDRFAACRIGVERQCIGVVGVSTTCRSPGYGLVEYDHSNTGLINAYPNYFSNHVAIRKNLVRNQKCEKGAQNSVIHIDLHVKGVRSSISPDVGVASCGSPHLR